MSEHAMRFGELSSHAPSLVSIVRVRSCMFIEGLSYGLKFGIAWELEIDATFHQVVEIASRLEHIRYLEREDREAKKPHGFGGSTSPYFLDRVRYGRGFVGHPV